jgi:hypothetical protein
MNRQLFCSHKRVAATFPNGEFRAGGWPVTAALLRPLRAYA